MSAACMVCIDVQTQGYHHHATFERVLILVTDRVGNPTIPMHSRMGSLPNTDGTDQHAGRVQSIGLRNDTIVISDAKRSNTKMQTSCRQQSRWKREGVQKCQLQQCCSMSAGLISRERSWRTDFESLSLAVQMLNILAVQCVPALHTHHHSAQQEQVSFFACMSAQNAITQRHAWSR